MTLNEAINRLRAALAQLLRELADSIDPPDRFEGKRKPPALTGNEEIRQALRAAMEGADVLKNWRNPAVRAANDAYERRCAFGPDEHLDAEWLANQAMKHSGDAQEGA
jgi:hypothetical protein